MYTGPNIITDGLVLYLDAANQKSYPGTGTTWSDLVTPFTNGTLNNISFNPNGYFDSGSCSFPTNLFISGSPQQGTFRLFLKIPPLDSSITSTIFFYDGGSTNNLVYLYRNSNWTTNRYAWLIYYTTTSATTNAILPDFTYLPGIWYDTVFTFSSIGEYKVYVNGELKLSQIALNFSSWNRTGNNTPSIRANSAVGTGNLALFQWYNRALSANEVLQNYNATKSRFNL